MPRGPRRKRTRLWAGLYRALFGTGDDAADQSTQEAAAAPSEAQDGSDGAKR